MEMALISGYYPFFVFVHIVFAALYVVTMIIMQLVVSKMMGKIPSGEGKNAAVHFLKTRWHPVVDFVIVVVGVSGALIAFFNIQVILQNGTLQLKLCLGTLSLLAAYANHFVFRGIKRNLIASGRNSRLLKRLNLVTGVFDKTALLLGIAAALIGVGMNHL